MTEDTPEEATTFHTLTTDADASSAGNSIANMIVQQSKTPVIGIICGCITLADILWAVDTRPADVEQNLQSAMNVIRERLTEWWVANGVIPKPEENEHVQ